MNDLSAFGIEVGQGKYEEEAFYGVALVYTALFNQVAKYLDRYELTPAKMNVLMIIKHQGKELGLSQREIGQRLMVTPSNMTRLLDKLERDHLIERFARAGDKRVNVIRVSKKGAALLDLAWPGYTLVMKRAMDSISVADQKTMAALLLKWFAGLKRTGDEHDD